MGSLKAKDEHQHYITVIETQDPTIYNGPRIAVFHTFKDAQTDVCEWINDELGRRFRAAIPAMKAYQLTTGRLAKIEEQ